MDFLAALVHELSEPQQRLTAALFGYLAGDRPHALGLVDADLERAARALAQTCETASRGIVYEHAADTAAAQRLAGELQQVVEAEREDGRRLSDDDAADVLRRIETGAREARRALGEDEDERAYLAMLGRVWAANRSRGGASRDPDADGKPASEGLIVLP